MPIAGTRVSVDVEGELTPARVKRFRKRVGLSASKFAQELGGYSRSYVKSIEGGSLPITQRFAGKFFAFVASDKARERGGLVLVSKHGLPRRGVLEILNAPRRCDGCGKWFVPVMPRQKRHNLKSCRTSARRRKGKR